MGFMEDIEKYGSMIGNFDISPAEMLKMLDIRSELRYNRNLLSYEEKVTLSKYDLKLLKYAEETLNYLSSIHNFNESFHHPNHFWWQLTLLCGGRYQFTTELINPYEESLFDSGERESR